MDVRSLSGDSGFIAYLTGSIPLQSLETVRGRLKRFPSVVIEQSAADARLPLLVIVLKRNLREAEEILSDCGWTEGKLPAARSVSGKEALKELEGKIHTLRTSLSETASEYTAKLETKRTWLAAGWTALSVHEKLKQITLFFTRTSKDGSFQRMGSGQEMPGAGGCT